MTAWIFSEHTWDVLNHASDALLVIAVAWLAIVLVHRARS